MTNEIAAIELYWKLNKDLIEERCKKYILDSIKTSNVYYYTEDEKIVGFITYRYFGDAGIDIIETHFLTKNRMAFMKCLARICKDKKTIVGHTTTNNKRMIEFFIKNKFIIFGIRGNTLDFFRERGI